MCVRQVTITARLLKNVYLFQHVTIPIPLEKEKVQEIEVLGEEVSQDTVWVATFDLVGRQAKVDALYKVPDLGNMILVEPPVEQNWIALRNGSIMICKCSHISDRTRSSDAFACMKLNEQRSYQTQATLTQ